MTARPSPESVLAEALNIPQDSVLSDSSIEHTEAWDSLAHFRLIAAIEAAIDRQLSPEEIFAAADYEGVKRLLET